MEENNNSETFNNVEQNNNVEMNNSVQPNNKGKGNGKGFLVVVILLLVIIVALVYFFVLPALSPKNNLEPTNNNSSTEPMAEPVENPTEDTGNETSEVIDLEYFSSKGLKKLVYNHNCYLVCDTEYEYELSTSDSKMMTNVLKVLKNNIVKKVSAPEGLGGPMESYTLKLTYDNESYLLHFINGMNYLIVYKGDNNKPTVTWSVNSSIMREVEKALSDADKKVIKEETLTGIDLNIGNSKNVKKVEVKLVCKDGCSSNYSKTTNDVNKIHKLYEVFEKYEKDVLDENFTIDISSESSYYLITINEAFTSDDELVEESFKLYYIESKNYVVVYDGESTEISELWKVDNNFIKKIKDVL